MPGKVIIGETRVGEAIVQKGEAAGKLMDDVFCGDGDNGCCCRTTLEIGYAANLKGKVSELPELLRKLNELPDIR